MVQESKAKEQQQNSNSLTNKSQQNKLDSQNMVINNLKHYFKKSDKVQKSD